MHSDLSITQNRNKRMIIAIMGLVMGMVGLAYASVPLYQLFCQVTGYGGTTQQSLEAPGASAHAIIRDVRFNAATQPDLKWHFKGPDKPVSVAPGEEVLIYYTATNLADVPTTGTSTFNVTPFKAGSYFMKIDCFCFEEQTLQPGETVEMPVLFYLDPDIDKDVNTTEVPEITLSYTFFAVENES
ncbi:MAG: cytochrome c oxidase assembly protein [Candidatus Puniceispirillales bacterium]